MLDAGERVKFIETENDVFSPVAAARDFLELHKIYRVIPDEDGAADGDIPPARE